MFVLTTNGAAAKITVHNVPLNNPLVQCRTPEGLKLQNFASAVEQAYGKPDGIAHDQGTTVWVYNQRGIQFYLKKSKIPQDNGREFVFAIAVFAPNQYCRLEGGVEALEGSTPLSCDKFTPPLH